MTPDDVGARVAQISRQARVEGGPETRRRAARLYYDVVRSVADETCHLPVECARKALLVEDVEVEEAESVWVERLGSLLLCALVGIAVFVVLQTTF